MNYEIGEEQLIIHVLNHLPEKYDVFVDAIEKDRQRIRDLFPNIKKEEWDDNTN